MDDSDAAVCAIFRERTEDDTAAGFTTGFFVTRDKLFTAHHSRQLFEPGEGKSGCVAAPRFRCRTWRSNTTRNAT